LALCIPATAFAAQPTGTFTVSPDVPVAGQPATFTAVNVTDPDNAGAVSISWSFGGSGSPAVNTFGVGTGTTSVTMTLIDSANETTTVTKNIRVDDPPIPDFTWSPNVAQVTSPTFGFTSTSTDDVGIKSYAWSFGDTASGPNASSTSHTYAGAGSYNVTLTVTDTDNVARSRSHVVRVNAPPVAKFSFAVPFPNLLPGEPYNIPVLNNPVAFSGNASSDLDGAKTITSYTWDLNGDGVFNDQSAQSFVQPLTTPGIVNVGLKVTASDGATATSIVPIRVDQLPVPSFTFSPTSPVAGQRVDLSSTSSDPDGAGDIAALNWDLTGSGKFTDAHGANLSVVFPTAGTYSIGVEAVDTAGLKVHRYQTLSVRVASSSSGSGSSSSGGAPFKIAIVSDGGPSSSGGASAASKSRLSVLGGIRVAVAGRVSKTFTKITKLVVTAPPGARVTGRCKGGGCHIKRESHRAGSSGRVRLRRFERTFRVGTQIVISITKSGQIGKQIAFTTRPGQAPVRHELCLMPGANKAKRCPG
jgi:PKD repeat protein